MTVIETLIKQCMNSGFFKSEEAARRYVMENCIAKNKVDEHYAEGEDLFDCITPNKTDLCDEILKYMEEGK